MDTERGNTAYGLTHSSLQTTHSFLRSPLPFHLTFKCLSRSLSPCPLSLSLSLCFSISWQDLFLINPRSIDYSYLATTIRHSPADHRAIYKHHHKLQTSFPATASSSFSWASSSSSSWTAVLPFMPLPKWSFLRLAKFNLRFGGQVKESEEERKYTSLSSSSSCYLYLTKLVKQGPNEKLHPHEAK